MTSLKFHEYSQRLQRQHDNPLHLYPDKYIRTTVPSMPGRGIIQDGGRKGHEEVLGKSSSF